MTLHFADPLWLLLLIMVPVMIWHYRRSRVAVRVPSIGRWKVDRRHRWQVLGHGVFGCRVLAVIAIAVAMARPQLGQSHGTRKTDGLDIMLVVDTSQSMQALDFVANGKRVTRLEVVQNVLKDFVASRPDDRLGLVVFGTHAFAQAPLTLDHDVLLRYIEGARIGMAGEATAIGDAIGVAVNRLKDLKAKSKVVILLTDGSNSAGRIDPVQAASAAKAMGVKVYTVGIGSNGPVPIRTEFGIREVIYELDEKSLKKIADTTGARYFSASDTQTLQEVYRAIDKLETHQVEVQVYHTFDEQFGWFVSLALTLLFMELTLRTTRWRRVP